MSRSQIFLVAAALLAVVLAGLALSQCKPRSTADGSAPEASAREARSDDGEEAALYFPATSGMLEIEVRTAPADLEATARKRWLAEQLVAGPETENLRSVLPADTRVASVFAAPDGTVFVDFTIPESDAFGMGSTEELLALYSVVNTMLLDDEAFERTVVLINGRQRETLAGHLDTSRPLYARPDLVRQPG